MTRSERSSRAAIRTLSVAILSTVAAWLLTVGVFVHVSHAARPGAPAALDVLPFPGTPDAAPQSEIDFPALTRSQIKSVTVTGSRSGAHSGRLSAIADHGGTAFLPDHPFAGGDQVTVHATLSSPAAGTASGDPGATQLSFGFTVAAPVEPPASAADSGDIPSSGGAHSALVHSNLNPAKFTHTFHSQPSIHPPAVGASGKDPDPASGDIFLDAENSIQAGPVILNPQGQLVWFDPLHHAAAFNVEVQPYQGQSDITFWEGYVTQGYGVGHDVLLNHSYQTVATVKAANGLHADLHEFQVTPQGDALITAYQPVHADLSSVGGPRNGTLLDSIVQEINIQTGKLVWEWHAYGHVHLSESYNGKPGSTPYDFFHANSIQQLPNGNFLISARHTWAIYEINPKTGRIVWVLGGKHSSFKVGPGAHFEWQHDARMQPDGTITVFDDGAGAGQQNESQSRGLRISLNMKSRTAKLVRGYANHPSLLASSQGNMQVLPDGNTFIGWGNGHYYSEFDRSGHQRLSGHYAAPVSSYRAYRFPWTGQPTAPPEIAAAITHNGTTVYASWNGATNVVSWRVYAGPSSTALTEVAQRRYNGFETAMSTASTQPYFFVQALGSSGQVLGNSAIIKR